MDEYSKMTIENQVNTYKTAWDEGYKSGFTEGKLAMWMEMKALFGALQKQLEELQKK